MNKFLPVLPNKEVLLNMLTVLREATEGKMFVEREYAACTR